MRPIVFGFLGLAVSVFLWGLSYKLSLYHLPRTPSARVSVAKLWTDPRNLSLLPAGVQTQSQAQFVAHAAVICGFERPPLVVMGIVQLPRIVRSALFITCLPPARSPPLPFFA